ncbi:ABC transporter permease [Bacteroides heparinolyticus]|uniref:ABC transporter permease n=2 Tax=Prevotella heparinolytica TaxID=28113 RepID=UPI0035A06346
MNMILRQIRNEWRSNLFLFVELLLVFAVLWYIVDWSLVTLRVYRAPMGFDVSHCYNITVNKFTPKSAAYNPALTSDDDIEGLAEIAERLRHRPGIEVVALSQNCFPYNEGSNGANVGIDSVSVNARLLWVEPDFFRLFRYGASDESGYARMAAALRDGKLVVSSNLMKDAYPELGLNDATSLSGREVKLLNFNDEPRLIGAVGIPVRSSHFYTTSQWGGSYVAVHLDMDRLKEYANPLYITLSVRVSPDADRDFVDKLMADADRLYQTGNLYLLDVIPLSEHREAYELEDMNETKTRLCVLGFLLMNIFLGVTGTFWFRTQQRRKEVALRMALGSSRKTVFFRLVCEGMGLLLLAAIPAVVIALNVGMAELVDVDKMPFTAGRFLLAVVFTLLLMALMIIAGISYPARKAMNIQPAEALHDE